MFEKKKKDAEENAKAAEKEKADKEKWVRDLASPQAGGELDSEWALQRDQLRKQRQKQKEKEAQEHGTTIHASSAPRKATSEPTP